jgi:peroxiredoxin
MTIPGCIFLPATDGQIVDLAKLSGRTIVFAFPRSGTPIVPWEEWDQIPGARGCTPHSCAFRDLKKDFENLGKFNGKELIRKISEKNRI